MIVPIKINLGDKRFDLEVDKSEEGKIRAVAKKFNEDFDELKKEYQDENEILYFLTYKLLIAKLDLEEKYNHLNKECTNIIDQLNQQIKEIIS